MDFSPRLNLPYLAAQQAQKHVTYNEAIQALDTLVQPAVISATTTAPPGSPAEGDAYLVPVGASGDWSGHDGAFATWLDGGWAFRPAADGWLVYVADDAEIRIRQPGGWAPLVTTGGSSVAMFGVNASPDATNRLAVAADAALFSHDGSDHRLKLNKAAAGDTGSVLFQSGWSGRAEFGLCGDDDFHVKVSADGTAWTEALRIGAATGAVALAAGQLGFPASQNPSADPNTLDDYAEGATTPSVGAASGAFGAVSASLDYVKVGRIVTFTATVVITGNGTAGGSIAIALPFSAAVDAPVSGQRTDTGEALAGRVSGSAANVWRYDGTYPGATAATLLVSGVYQV